MRNPTKTEFCGLVIAVMFFLGGLFLIIWPQSGAVPHFTNDDRGMSPHTEMEFVTETGSRIYGIIAVLLGVCVVWFTTYREEDDS